MTLIDYKCTKFSRKGKTNAAKTLKYKRGDNTRSLCVQFTLFCWIFNSYLIRTFAQNAPHCFCYCWCCWMHLESRCVCVCVCHLYLFRFFCRFTNSQLNGHRCDLSKTTERKHYKMEAAEKRTRKFTCYKINTRYIYMCVYYSGGWKTAECPLKIGHNNSSDCSVHKDHNACNTQLCALCAY